MSRPEPQPATSTSRVQKVRDPHPALSAGGPASAAMPHPAEDREALVPFNARIPTDVRQQLRYLSVATGRSIQDLATEALREYIGQHRDSPQIGK